MGELELTGMQDDLAQALRGACAAREPIDVTDRGRRLAVILDAAVYDALVGLAEDAVDRSELDAARTEDEFIPWEQVRSDLGLA